MNRSLSPILFAADFSGAEAPTRESYVVITAADADFKERWLQNAIANNPELVLAVCRAGGLIDNEERLKFWGQEIRVGAAGSIDVLLLSESGRIGIVETKLSYNPEARRVVIAQVLEYAIHLPFALTDLPPIPQTAEGRDFVDIGNIEDQIHGPLLIIAGDQLDPRAIKLSNALSDKHMIHGWDLALVEVAIYEQKTDSDKKDYLVVPHLGGAVTVKERQVFHVVIDENRTRVTVEQTPGPVTVNRQKWDEERFFAEAERATVPLREFANQLRLLRDKYPETTFDFGSSKGGSLIVKKNSNSVLEFNLNDGDRGFIRFRRDKIVSALGEECGKYYLTELEARFPRSMEMDFPLAYFHSDGAARVLPLLENVLKRSDSQRHGENCNHGFER